MIVPTIRQVVLDGTDIRTLAEFYRQLARSAPDLAERVVFITGGASLESSREFLANVPNAALDKPFTRAALSQIVGEVKSAGRAGGPAAERR